MASLFPPLTTGDLTPLQVRVQLVGEEVRHVRVQCTRQGLVRDLLSCSSETFWAAAPRPSRPRHRSITVVQDKNKLPNTNEGLMTHECSLLLAMLVPSLQNALKMMRGHF